ncbi:uncharacterized protein MYCFIDRAFT_179691 [Pseudocercospora fijiensis CIRAD86]|uniref:Uncharacterized protein n=1 Tax=Pseudocercospora fijiensis (strain CIRAD86) TaxID=383855 RepID=M2YI83_PSEFD|nr:uncharacterized protein MYCFIDRAFT_179691 [Pseudocercospora fijiensis CIRAD86]EME77480.1 hypothetical protein MYCFIDRAFT_179691 [Pseudocercospora fijiensis CIRAD86]
MALDQLTICVKERLNKARARLGATPSPKKVVKGMGVQQQVFGTRYKEMRYVNHEFNDEHLKKQKRKWSRTEAEPGTRDAKARFPDEVLQARHRPGCHWSLNINLTVPSVVAYLHRLLRFPPRQSYATSPLPKRGASDLQYRSRSFIPGPDNVHDGDNDLIVQFTYDIHHGDEITPGSDGMDDGVDGLLIIQAVEDGDAEIEEQSDKSDSNEHLPPLLHPSPQSGFLVSRRPLPSTPSSFLQAVPAARDCQTSAACLHTIHHYSANAVANVLPSNTKLCVSRIPTPRPVRQYLLAVLYHSSAASMPSPSLAHSLPSLLKNHTASFREILFPNFHLYSKLVCSNAEDLIRVTVRRVLNITFIAFTELREEGFARRLVVTISVTTDELRGNEDRWFHRTFHSSPLDVHYLLFHFAFFISNPAEHCLILSSTCALVCERLASDSLGGKYNRALAALLGGRSIRTRLKLRLADVRLKGKGATASAEAVSGQNLVPIDIKGASPPAPAYQDSRLNLANPGSLRGKEAITGA